MTINMKRLSANLLADYIASHVSGLAGKVSAVSAGPEQIANCLAVKLLPEAFSFYPGEPDEIYFAEPDDGKVVVDVGLFSGLFTLQLFTTSPAERELYEQKIVDLFLAADWAPGTLYLQLPNVTVNGYASLYTAEIKASLVEDSWSDELAFESKRYSFIEIEVDFPALTTYMAATIEDLQLAFSEDLDKLILTVDDGVITDRVEIQEDGTTIPATD